jgi:hypothetical protein
MSDWLEQSIKDTWRWDRLKWPRGLNASSAGEYRIYEKPQYGEQRFFPQWRVRDTHSWQYWLRVTWGRFGSEERVSFDSLQAAQAWLDRAVGNRPFIAEHQYTPKRTADEEAEWLEDKRAEEAADRICGHAWSNI